MPLPPPRFHLQNGPWPSQSPPPQATDDNGILPASFFDLGDGLPPMDLDPSGSSQPPDFAAEFASLQDSLGLPAPSASTHNPAQATTTTTISSAAIVAPTDNAKSKPKLKSKPKGKAESKKEEQAAPVAVKKEQGTQDAKLSEDPVKSKSKSKSKQKKAEATTTADESSAKPKKSKKKADAKKGATPVSNAAVTAPELRPSTPTPAKRGGSKASTRGRSPSRMSSAGRDMNTPALAATGGDEEMAPPPVPTQRKPGGGGEDDDEPPPEEEEAEAEDELGGDHYSNQEAIYAAQQRSMGLLSMVMDDDQLDRHMASRRGALSKSSVRKLVNHVLSQSVSQHVAMVASGVAKIFVGEMVEKARAVQAERGDNGALRPIHLYEAHRMYQQERERPGYYPPGANTGSAGIGKRRRLF